MLLRGQKNLSYRKVFLLGVEGKVTETEYFDQFKKFHAIQYASKRGGNSPKQILSSLKVAMNKMALKEGDQVWIVIDRDEWRESEIDACAAWVAKMNGKVKVGLALSNPKFEFWLLLHFEDGEGYTSQGACVQRLKSYIPDYDKHIKGHDWLGMAPRAIERALQKLDDSPWPKKQGTTTVALLVDELLK
jgi:hypothetical protein